MAVAATEIANRALARLGVPRITSLDEPSEAGSPASEIKEAWEPLRRFELRLYPWKFAMARGKLAQDGEAPAFGYLRRYRVPPSMVRLVQVGLDATDPPAFEQEGRFILTDAEAPLAIRYVYDETNVEAWDPAFAEAFAAKLAAELCERITGNTTKRQLAIADYDRTLRDAKRVGAIESPSRAIRDSAAWLDARL